VNGTTGRPVLTFGVNCNYGVLDSILNGNRNTSYEKDGISYGWAVRIWVRGLIVTGLWGWTDYNHVPQQDLTKVLLWDVEANDYCLPVEIPTDEITRLEIL